MQLLKKRVKTFAMPSRDRGLLIRGSLKEQKGSKLPGPGNYNTLDHSSIMGSIMQKMSRRSPNKATTNMSQASREFTFAKYASGNSKIYTSLH